MSIRIDGAGMPRRHTITRGITKSGPFDLACSVEGAGPPALVIGSAVYYPRTFSPHLRNHMTLIFADHRGFAACDRPVTTDDFGFDTVITDMERVRAAQGLERMTVIGHSGHAFMALEYARRHPERVERLVLIAAAPALSPAHHALAERDWDEAVCPERKAIHARAMAGLPDALAADPDRAFVTFCVRMGARAWADPTFDAGPLWDGVTVHMAAFDHLWGTVFRDIDIRPALAALSMPVFLALGRHDHQMPPPATWEPLRPLVRDLTVRVFEDAGHTPQLEQAAAFDAELLAWMEL